MAKTLTVKRALEIFTSDKLQGADDSLLTKFSHEADVDINVVNKSALVAKLYRYKNKMKLKRGPRKFEFENAVFSIPVHTITGTQQPNICGSLRNDEISSLELTFQSLASELQVFKKETVFMQSKLNTEMLKSDEHDQKMSSLKRSHNYEVKGLTKKLKRDKYKLLWKVNKLERDNKLMECKVNENTTKRQNVLYEH
jgi:hypothetical protein